MESGFARVQNYGPMIMVKLLGPEREGAVENNNLQTCARFHADVWWWCANGLTIIKQPDNYPS